MLLSSPLDREKYEELNQARHYFCESLFWASEPKQAAKITWRA